MFTCCEECDAHGFMDEPDAFLEGDCAAEDMGALLAMSACCWEDCSAPISGLNKYCFWVDLR